MAVNANVGTGIVEKDIHCPYCSNEKGLMISQPTFNKLSVQLPEVGLKFVLLMIYFAFVQLLTQGFKLIEIKKEYRATTYAFCPHCGNTFSMAAPEAIKREVQEPRLCRYRTGKVASGLCKGIAELTGLSVTRVRLITILYGLLVIPALFYLVASFLTPINEDYYADVNKGKFYRIRQGKDLMGLCRGLSEYTEISLWLIRLAMLLVGPFYFIIAACFPVKEDVEQGIAKKRLRKIKEGKVLFGMCTGMAAYSNWPLWLLRILGVLLFPVYLILAAVVPNQEN